MKQNNMVRLHTLVPKATKADLKRKAKVDKVSVGEIMRNAIQRELYGIKK